MSTMKSNQQVVVGATVAIAATTAIYSNQQVVVGATAAIAATAAIYSLATPSKKKEDITLLVFPDGGEMCSKSGGLEPNALTIHVQSDLTMDFLKNSVAKALEIDMHRAKEIRLWVQVTKEEVTGEEKNLKSVLSNKDGLPGSIVLICTQNRANLSSEAASSEPLEYFSYPSNVRDLSFLGLGHLLAFRNGKHELPLYNGYENLFRGRESTTLLIRRPPYTNDSYDKYYPDINYHPSKEYGNVVTVDPDMITEMLNRQCDFPKMWTSKYEKRIQEYSGLGLFSNSTVEESWDTGHGVLPKFFNAIRIKNYFPMILEKTQSFVQQWVARGNNAKIDDVNDWLVCMTSDAVCKASMDLDMRNVERKGEGKEIHPFIKSFRYCVKSIKFQEKDKARYEKELKVGQDIIKDLVEKSRTGEIGGPLSFITGMLEQTASTNGEYVHFDDFYGHCINIMVAGHETTGGTIAFCLAELCRNPDCLAKAVKEIEDVLGNRSSPTLEDISKLVYLEACFRETLRLYAPVQSSKRECRKDNIVLGNRLLRRGQNITFMFWGVNRDPEQWDQGVFGDVEKFNPDRHLSGAPPRHANSFSSFGFGVRTCIGMQFALLEAKTFLCLILNFFHIQTPPDYKIIPSVGNAFTACPKGLCLNLSFRTGGPLSRIDLFASKNSSPAKQLSTTGPPEIVPEKDSDANKKNGGSVLILYGSNTGTCEEFASLLADKCTEDGFQPEVMTMDQSVNKLPNTDSPVLIVSSTYNGTPPDNAGEFNEWMTSAKEGSLKGMRFAVFGVGNSNWESTYQNFPNAINRCLLANGAIQIKDITKADVSTSSFAEEFDDWVTDIMGIVGLNNGIPAVVKKPPAKKRMLYVKVVDAKSIKEDPVTCEVVLRQRIHDALQSTLKNGNRLQNPFEPCKVTKSIQLHSEYSDRSTCHVELALSSPEITYEAGDHLGVLCRNDENMITSTLEVLALKGNEIVECNPGLSALFKKFPADLPRIPLTSRLAITWLPDLAASPTRKVLNRLAELCPCPPEAAALRDLAEKKNYTEKVLNMKLSLPEILSMYQSVSIDIEEFCACLPRLKQRYYSISSSPLVDPTRVAITVGLVEYKTKMGRHHKGFASGMINSLEVGSNVFASIHKLNSKFKLPKDLSTPTIMIGPGTGVAPFMGFLEERNILAKEGKKLGPAHLFFGCRNSKTDFIYKDALEEYTKNGVLSTDGLHVAFSREEGQEKVYVQDLIGEFGQELWDMIDKGAIVYICGDAKRMSPNVKAAFVDVAVKQGMSNTKAENWMGSMMSNNRYLEDVYA